jgi:prepilin-type processing-associated H-X9-DG protein
VFGDGSGWYLVFGDNKTHVGAQLSPPYRPGIDVPNVGDIRGEATTNGRFVGRHSDGANFVFADGHTKWMPIREVARPNRNGILFWFTIEDDR